MNISSIDLFMKEHKSLTSPTATANPSSKDYFYSHPRNSISVDANAGNKKLSRATDGISQFITENSCSEEVNRRLVVLSEKAESMLMLANLMEIATDWKLKCKALEKKVNIEKTTVGTNTPADVIIYDNEMLKTRVAGLLKKVSELESSLDLAKKELALNFSLKKRCTVSSVATTTDEIITSLVDSCTSPIKSPIPVFSVPDTSYSDTPRTSLSEKDTQTFFDIAQDSKPNTFITEYIKATSADVQTCLNISYQIQDGLLKSSVITRLRKILHDLDCIKFCSDDFCNSTTPVLPSPARTSTSDTPTISNSNSPSISVRTPSYSSSSKQNDFNKSINLSSNEKKTPNILGLLDEIRARKGQPLRKSIASTFPKLAPSLNKVRDIRETLKEALLRHRDAMDSGQVDEDDDEEEEEPEQVYKFNYMSNRNNSSTRFNSLHSSGFESDDSF